MTIAAFVGASVDGFIARPDGTFDFLPADGGGEAGGFDAFLAGIDVLVMGRNTFDVVQGMTEWPYGDKRVVVLTHRPLAMPAFAKGKAETMQGPPADVVARLAERGLRNLYVDGGQTIQSFLRAGLLDRVTVTRVPVLIGQGIPLFGPLARDVPLRLVSSRSIGRGMVQDEYEVVR